MDLTALMQAIQNPQRYILNQFASQMIKEHPQEWNQCQQMFGSKNRKQQLAELRKLYASKGMDLDSTAKQYGVQL